MKQLKTVRIVKKNRIGIELTCAGIVLAPRRYLGGATVLPRKFWRTRKSANSLHGHHTDVVTQVRFLSLTLTLGTMFILSLGERIRKFSARFFSKIPRFCIKHLVSWITFLPISIVIIPCIQKENFVWVAIKNPSNKLNFLVSHYDLSLEKLNYAWLRFIMIDLISCMLKRRVEDCLGWN